MTVVGLVLRLTGECHTEWHTMHVKRYALRGGHIVYIRAMVRLLADCQITPGVHEYDFAFVLPPACPSSYEHDTGHVRYTIKCSLEMPLLQLNRHHTRTVRVVAADPIMAHPNNLVRGLFVRELSPQNTVTIKTTRFVKNHLLSFAGGNVQLA